MSALTSLRLPELQWNTNEYIKAKPTTISLVPTRGDIAISKPGGGHDFPSPLPRAAQQFRLIVQTGFDGIELSPNDDGMSRKFAYIIVGSWNAQLAIGDMWSEGANRYHVDSIEPYNGYEVRGKVTAFASEPDHG